MIGAGLLLTRAGRAGDGLGLYGVVPQVWFVEIAAIVDSTSVTP